MYPFSRPSNKFGLAGGLSPENRKFLFNEN